MRAPEAVTRGHILNSLCGLKCLYLGDRRFGGRLAWRLAPRDFQNERDTCRGSVCPAPAIRGERVCVACVSNNKKKSPGLRPEVRIGTGGAFLFHPDVIRHGSLSIMIMIVIMKFTRCSCQNRDINHSICSSLIYLFYMQLSKNYCSVWTY